MSNSFEKMMDDYANRYTKVCVENNQIDPGLFEQFGVARTA